MKRFVIVSAIVGFCLPICWGVLGLLTLEVPQSPAAAMLWLTIQVTCPPWQIPQTWTLGAFVATMGLNAALYAVAACVLALALRGFARVLGRPVPFARPRSLIVAVGVLGAAVAILPVVTDTARWPRATMLVGACAAIGALIAYCSIRPRGPATAAS